MTVLDDALHQDAVRQLDSADRPSDDRSQTTLRAMYLARARHVTVSYQKRAHRQLYYDIRVIVLAERD
jgi:hypothetical protein